jgi:uncharacterized protein (TIGR02231 family)
MGARRTLDAPVSAVVLLEDRAQVTRKATVALDAGSHALLIEAVTPLLADRSITARFIGSGRLDETRVHRQWRVGAEERPPEAAELERELRRLTRALDDQELHLERGRHQREMVEGAIQLYVDNVNRVMPFSELFEPRWAEDLHTLLQGLQDADAELLGLQREHEALQREHGAAQIHAGQVLRIDHVLAADLWLDVTADAPGEVTLEVEYTVPCALWRPIHRATLDADTVRVECEAAVWQATGEDWSDVQLRFSTARPTLRAEPPLLHDDLLRVRRKADKKVAVEVREQAIATTGEGRSEEADGLPGVADGGETRLLDAAVRTTVVADGRMRRIPVLAFDAPAEIDRLCCPERAPLVHLRSRQVNTASQPVLAGPVDLIRNGGYVGRTEVGFVAPAERFALGWGSQDGLRVRREVHEDSETARLTGKKTHTTRVELFLSNLDDRPATFDVQERIPVSEIDKVKVEVDRKKTRPAASPDDDGIVTWRVELPPHGTDEIELVYSVIATSKVEGL